MAVSSAGPPLGGLGATVGVGAAGLDGRAGWVSAAVGIIRGISVSSSAIAGGASNSPMARFFCILGGIEFIACLLVHNDRKKGIGDEFFDHR